MDKLLTGVAAGSFVGKGDESRIKHIKITSPFRRQEQSQLTFPLSQQQPRESFSLVVSVVIQY